MQPSIKVSIAKYPQMELNRLVLSLLATQEKNEIHNPKMIIMLSRTGAAAAATKYPSAFSTPDKSAARKLAKYKGTLLGQKQQLFRSVHRRQTH